MSEAPPSDVMTNLVKFLFCLAIAGMVVALFLYFAVLLPAQQTAALVPFGNPFPPVISPP